MIENRMGKAGCSGSRGRDRFHQLRHGRERSRNPGKRGIGGTTDVKVPNSPRAVAIDCHLNLCDTWRASERNLTVSKGLALASGAGAIGRVSAGGGGWGASQDLEDLGANGRFYCKPVWVLVCIVLEDKSAATGTDVDEVGEGALFAIVVGASVARLDADALVGRRVYVARVTRGAAHQPGLCLARHCVRCRKGVGRARLADRAATFNSKAIHEFMNP